MIPNESFEVAWAFALQISNYNGSLYVAVLFLFTFLSVQHGWCCDFLVRYVTFASSRVTMGVRPVTKASSLELAGVVVYIVLS